MSEVLSWFCSHLWCPKLVTGTLSSEFQGALPWFLCWLSHLFFCSVGCTHPPSCKPILPSLLTQFVFHLCLGNVTTSTSVSQMASGISLVSFNSRPDGMHQRSYSVSSADQWSEATVIANSGISSGKKPGAGEGYLLWGEGGIWWFAFFMKKGKKCSLVVFTLCWKSNFQHLREKKQKLDKREQTNTILFFSRKS